MSTPRQGMAGTGGDQPPQADPNKKSADEPKVEMTDPPAPEIEEEIRKRAIAKLQAGADSGIVTTRLPEPTPFDIIVDSDNIIQGAVTTSGFIVWMVPNKLMSRLKKHYLVTSGRIVLPEGAGGDDEKPAQVQTHPTQKAHT